MGQDLKTLLPTIQFVSTFFGLPTDVDFPVAAKADPKTVLEGHFEEFLGYQTHHADGLQFVLHQRDRKMP